MVQLSVSAKLNLLLISTVFALSVYLYFILKDVGRFEQTVTKGLVELKAEIEKLKMPSSQAHAGPSAIRPMVSTVPSTPAAMLAVAVSQPLGNEHDDDDVSIMSNEIKNIISNIQEAEAGETDGEEVSEDGQEEEQDIATVEEQVPQQVHQEHNRPQTISSSLSKEELAFFTNGELRDYLKSKGLSTNGNKDTLVQRILSAQ